MDLRTRIQNEISVLTDAIRQSPENISLYLERGKLYHHNGSFDRALNDFNVVATLDPENSEAQAYIAMLMEIFEFRYKDIYNP